MAKKTSFDWEYTDSGLIIRGKQMKISGLFCMLCFGIGFAYCLIPVLIDLFIELCTMLRNIPIDISAEQAQISALWHDLSAMYFTPIFLLVGVWGMWLYMRKHSYTFDQDNRELIHVSNTFRFLKTRRFKFDDIETVFLHKKRLSVEHSGSCYTVKLTLPKSRLLTLELTGDYQLALSHAQDLRRILQDFRYPQRPNLELSGMRW